MSPGLAARALLLYFAPTFTHHPRRAPLNDCEDLGGATAAGWGFGVHRTDHPPEAALLSLYTALAPEAGRR